MSFLDLFRLWLERRLRARRYARAQKPSHPAPAWIREAESFSLLGSNPMSSIAAGKVGWLENAGQASRLLSRYALELQQAADSLEASRSRLALSDAFAQGGSAPSFASDRHFLSDASEFGMIERQRRALSFEREALCLLTSALRQRYGAFHLHDGPSAIDLAHTVLGGMTLLSYFVSIRRLDVVEHLIEAGASPDAPCSDGLTPIEIASRKAEAFAGSSGAAHQAAMILSLLESSSLHGQVGIAHSSRGSRI